MWKMINSLETELYHLLQYRKADVYSSTILIIIYLVFMFSISKNYLKISLSGDSWISAF